MKKVGTKNSILFFACGALLIIFLFVLLGIDYRLQRTDCYDWQEWQTLDGGFTPTPQMIAQCQKFGINLKKCYTLQDISKVIYEQGN